jgi:uncharacterized protein
MTPGRYDSSALNPTAPSEREPILDALRGFAILGILLVNVEVMRGPEWLIRLGGDSVEPPEALIDRIAQFVVGWLAAGKFVSSLAFLFGLGAALIAARALHAGRSPRPLLARRYVWLMAFGLAHMLLYPGDILFLYGLTGIALLFFVKLRVRTLLLWAAAILGAYTALGVSYLVSMTEAHAAVGHMEPAAEGLDGFTHTHYAQALAAFGAGSPGDIAAVHVTHALLLQGMQLPGLPWVLALFLFGYAAGRAGIVNDLRAHRGLLRGGAWFGLGVGLPVNIGQGLAGPLANWGPPPPSEPVWVTQWAMIGDLIGEPMLALGYLCALTLVCLRRGAISPLAAVGRMALTAYLLQSALALCVFGGLRLYGQLSAATALLVVAGIWALLLVACPLWLRAFRLGPVEWLWRSLTYGRVQPMRVQRP